MQSRGHREPLIEYPQPDGMLQLKILRELAQLMNNGSDLNMIMEMVMEGIYRGVGMDRVLFALITPDKKGLRAKQANMGLSLIASRR